MAKQPIINWDDLRLEKICSIEGCKCRYMSAKDDLLGWIREGRIRLSLELLSKLPDDPELRSEVARAAVEAKLNRWTCT